MDATWGPASVHSPEVASTNFDCSPSHFVEAREWFWFRLFPVNKTRTSPDNLPSRCKELHVSGSTTSTFWRFGELSIQHTTCFWALYQVSANTFTSRSSSVPGTSKSAGVLRSNHIPWVRQGSNPFLVLRCYWPLDAAFSHAWKRVWTNVLVWGNILDFIFTANGLQRNSKEKTKDLIQSSLQWTMVPPWLLSALD